MKLEESNLDVRYFLLCTAGRRLRKCRITLPRPSNILAGTNRVALTIKISDFLRGYTFKIGQKING